MAQFKLNEGFKEEDLIIEAAPQGTERHSIFEMDLTQKTCLFRVGNVYKTLTLLDSHIEAIQTALTPVWHNEGDKLRVFAIFNDGQYYCQRLLSKFDFATKEVTNKYYEFDQMSYADAKEVYEICKAVCWIRAEQQVASLEEDLVGIAEVESFGETQFNVRKSDRNNLLSRCDFRMLPDYTEAYAGEQAAWSAYRSALRTIPKTEDQFEDRAAWLAYLGDMPFPIDPKMWKANDELKDLEYLSTDAFWSTKTTIHSSSADQQLAEELTALKSRQAEIDQFGKRINLHLRDVIKKYSLDRGMMNFDLQSYTPVEEA
jgi:hypothetical protein